MISILTKHQFLCSNTPVTYFHFFMMYLLITVTCTHTPTRHSNEFHLNNPKQLLAHRSIRHHGPDTWNLLPESLKTCKTLFTFKTLMKKHLLSKYNK